ncbi:MAG: 23S rRNA (guanosine(2251)-2'-O)-methyltransferase RlmB [Marinilabiliales bacterium]|nr:MAG: 23S rRNA (guanosine(2251)-2'-O)-methyltransferase RlmB [Marinilabiliales bacterium]
MNKKESKPNTIYGLRAIIEAIEAGKTIEKVLLKQNLNNELSGTLWKYSKKQNIQVQYVPVEKLNSIHQKNHQGAIAYISPVSFFNLEEVVEENLEKGATPLLLLLDGITDVRNFGAIARSAECAGATAIVVPKNNSARINADAIKTSAGALHKIPVCKVADLMDAVFLLKDMGIQIVAASEKTEKTLFEANLKVPSALIMGSEDKGISPKVLKAADEHCKIPLTGDIQSLNVSVASGIFLFEAIRQRSQ